MSDAWRRLSYFESADLTADFYRSRHGRPANSGQILSITAHITQGRQYFVAAQGAGELAKPLLLYYGVLALARGLILFVNPSKREASLSERHGVKLAQSKESGPGAWLDDGHGVEAVGWSNTLSGTSTRRTTQLSDLTLSIRPRGTFAELADATRNVQRAFLPVEHGEMGVILTREGTHAFEEPISISVKELLARIPQLDLAYEATFGEFPKCIQVFIESLSVQPAIRLELATVGTRTISPSVDQICEVFRLPRTHFVERASRLATVGVPRHHFSFSVESLAELKSMMPATVSIPMPSSYTRRAWYFVETKEVSFSQLSLLYLVSYTMGMLVRYFPSTWSLLNSRSAGDRILPLLRRSLEVIEHHVPNLILQEIESTDTQSELVLDPDLWVEN